MKILFLGAFLTLLMAGGARAEIVTRDLDYAQDGAALQGFLAWDDALPGRRPAVLIAHQWKGLGDYEKQRARQLAELGYVAFAVDIYGNGVRPQTAQEAGALSGKFKGDRALLRARMNAALEEIRKRPDVDPARIAAIGYCFGGTAVLELARSGADLAGVVSFHGGLATPSPEDAKNIRCATLVLHGGNDPYAPADEVAGFLKEMQASTAPWEVVLYGHAVHSFTDPGAGADPSSGAAYDARADRESWEAMRRFFDRLFTSVPKPDPK